MEATVKGRSSSVPKKKKGFSSFYTKGEEIFNAVSHIVGGAFGVAGHGDDGDDADVEEVVDRRRAVA